MNYWVIFCRAALFASWHKRTTHDMLSLLRMHVSSLALLTEQLVIVRSIFLEHFQRYLNNFRPPIRAAAFSFPSRLSPVKPTIPPY